MTITFDTGNTLSIAFQQQWDRQAGEFGGDVGFFVVIGGTGQFASATGSGAMDALYMDKQGANVRIVLNGTIVVE